MASIPTQRSVNLQTQLATSGRFSGLGPRKPNQNHHPITDVHAPLSRDSRERILNKVGHKMLEMDTHRWNNTGYFVLPLSSMSGGRNSTAFSSETGRKKIRSEMKDVMNFHTVSLYFNGRMNDGGGFVHMNRIVQHHVGHQQTCARWTSTK